MLGFILALLSAISFSLNNIFSKKLSQKLGVLNSLVLICFFVSIISFSLGIFFGDFKHIWNFNIFLNIFFGGLVGMTGILSLLKSFEKLSVAETLAIANIYPFISMFLFIIFLNQNIYFFQILLMILVFIGIFLTLNNSSKFTFNKFIIYPIVTAFSWGIYYFILNLLSNKGINSFNILFYIEFSIFLFVLMYLLFNKNNNFKFSLLNLKLIKNGFLAGFFSTIGVLFFIFSFRLINPSISASIVSAQVIFSTIFAYLIFKEKLNKTQIFGIIIVFIGIALFKLI